MKSLAKYRAVFACSLMAASFCVCTNALAQKRDQVVINFDSVLQLSSCLGVAEYWIKTSKDQQTKISNEEMNKQLDDVRNKILFSNVTDAGREKIIKYALQVMESSSPKQIGELESKAQKKAQKIGKYLYAVNSVLNKKQAALVTEAQVRGYGDAVVCIGIRKIMLSFALGMYGRTTTTDAEWSKFVHEKQSEKPTNDCTRVERCEEINVPF